MFLSDYVSFLLLISVSFTDESTAAIGREFQGNTKEWPRAILPSDQGKAKLTVIYHIYCSNEIT